MQQKTSSSPWWVWLLMAGLGYKALAGGAAPAPAPMPPTPGGPDLRAAFAMNNDRTAARTDAHVLATIFKSLGKTIDYDANRRDATGKLLPPRLTNGVQFDDLRYHLRDLRMNGWSFAQTYPLLGPTIHNHLVQAVGDKGDEIDDTKRRAWVLALNQLAASCELAAK